MRRLLPLVVFVLAACGSDRHKPAIVMQTDFGLKDGAVSAMKGVAKSVDPDLALYDLTHEIPPFDIWEAAYRLNQTVGYWPAGTVFVSVVDPGVGTDRRSVVALLHSGQYVVTPDNGVLTLLAEYPGIVALRQIDEAINRRAGSSASYTFHGRDVYAYVAAKLAAGMISYEEVGPLLKTPPVLLSHVQASLSGKGSAAELVGGIPALDPAYGNVWTNISDSLLNLGAVKTGDSLDVEIRHEDKIVLRDTMPYVTTFGAVPEGKPLAYLNSLLELSFALNRDDLAKKYAIGKGPGWIVHVQRIPGKSIK